MQPTICFAVVLLGVSGASTPRGLALVERLPVCRAVERSPSTGELRTDDVGTNYTAGIVIDDGKEMFWQVAAHWETTSEILPYGGHVPHAYITVDLEWDEVNGTWVLVRLITRGSRGNGNESLFFPAVR